MSQVNELLNNLSEEELALYMANPETEPHIVVNNDRTVTIPAELKKIAVQFDHNIETVTFDCPRYWDGLDMSKMVVYINYKRPDDYLDSYPADNVRVSETDENIMHFEWTLSRNVTLVKGTLSFLVCVKKTDENGDEVNHWNSELNRELIISEGLECNESVVEQYPDIITQILLRINSLDQQMDHIDTNGGTTNIDNSIVKGYNCGGIVKAFQPKSAELVVCPYDAETGSLSIGDVITAVYNNSDPNLRAKATFTYQGNTYEIDNVGDFDEIKNKLGLTYNDDIGLRFTFNNVEGIEVGMTYNLCYPKGTKFRYGKVLFVEKNSIIVDNETTGIHRYYSINDALPVNDSSLYGNVIINGGLIGEVELTDSDGVSLRAEGIETFAGVGACSDGYKTRALSFGAYAGGKETDVSGFGAFGHGVLLDIAAHHGFGGGEVVRIFPIAYASTGFGSRITLRAPYEFGAGANIDISGKHGFGVGASLEILGDYAGALNYSNKARGTGALATGGGTEANADFSFTSGYHTIANKPYQAVFGRYNEEDVDGEYLLILGNGSANNRVNIFTIDANGSGWFKGNIDVFAGNFRSSITSAGSISAAGNISGAEASFKKIYSTGDIYANGYKKVALDENLPKKIKDGEGARSVKFGSATKAPGNDSFAGGNNSEANAMRTITVGQWTVAESPAQATFGKFNTRDFDEKYVFMLGNGRSDSLRSDAVVVDWQGNAYLAGNVYVGHNNIGKVGGTVQAYTAATPSVKVANSPFIAVDKIIEVNDEYRTITAVSISGVSATLTLDSAFTVSPKATDAYLIYNSVAERNKDKSEMLATRKYVDQKFEELKRYIDEAIK